MATSPATLAALRSTRRSAGLALPQHASGDFAGHYPADDETVKDLKSLQAREDPRTCDPPNLNVVAGSTPAFVATLIPRPRIRMSEASGLS